MGTCAVEEGKTSGFAQHWCNSGARISRKGCELLAEPGEAFGLVLERLLRVAMPVGAEGEGVRSARNRRRIGLQERQIRLYGTIASPYALKLRSQMRYQRIAFDWYSAISARCSSSKRCNQIKLVSTEPAAAQSA